MRRWVGGLGAVCLAVGLALGAARVLELEQGELEVVGEPVALASTDGQPHRELGRARLARGDDVTFEVCADDALAPDTWSDAVELIVWHPEDQEVVVRTPLDRDVLEGASRTGSRACVVVANGRDLPVAGDFAVEAVWEGRRLPPEADRVHFRAHVLAHRPLAPTDPLPVALTLLGALLALALGPVPNATPLALGTGPNATPGGVVRVVVGVGVFLAALFGVGLVPIGGATAGLARGLTLAAVQVACAFVLVRPALGGRAAGLGVSPPVRARWALYAAPLFGVVLWLAGGLAMRLVPATGVAPIETLVSWPSGTLAVALVAVVVPVAEELFFRGFVFGTVAARWGGAAAFAVTVTLFALAHLPQDWGAWGALTSIAVTGVGLTALRWWTGSILVPALAHLAHNAVIVALTLL